MSKPSKWRIGLYLTGLFLAGAVTGAVLTAFAGRELFLRAMSQDAMARHWRRELEKRLSLTPEQSARIAPVINEALDALRVTVGDQMQTTLSNCNARIAVELTPEQRTRFAAIEREQTEFVRSRFQRAGADDRDSPARGTNRGAR